MDGHQKQREQSCRMIEEALFALMQEKSFEEITVSELAKRADVARRTFYRLYTGKEDVIRGYFKRLCEEYESTCPMLDSYDTVQIAEDYFSFWYSYRSFLLLLYKRGLEEMLYGEIRRACVHVVRKRMSNRQEKEDEDIEYFACYSAGGFLMLLNRWISEGMKDSPQLYARKTSMALMKFIMPVQTGHKVI